MRAPVPLCRLAYRCAYALLRCYWFLRRPHILGVKCVLTDGDRVLLVRHTYGRRQWDLPGGSVKRAEPPASAATREMREELGVTITGWRLLGEIRAEIDYRHDDMLCFHQELKEPEVTMDPCELEAVQWFSRAALPRPLSPLVDGILARLNG